MTGQAPARISPAPAPVPVAPAPAPTPSRRRERRRVRAALKISSPGDAAEREADFETAVGLPFEFAGAEGLRYRLVHDDWQARLDGDPALMRIATSL